MQDASRWRNPWLHLVPLVLALVVTEALGRWAFDSSLDAFRRSLVALVAGGALLAGRGGLPVGLVAGTLGGLYAVHFLHAFGTAPETLDRILFGTVMGTFLFVAAAIAGRLADVSRRLARDAVEAERRRAAALEAANREMAATNLALRDFTHVVSHDLRNPVRGIQTVAAFLERDLAPKLSDHERQDLALLRRETDRLASLLEALLEYSRATRFDPADLHAVRVADLLAGEGCQARFATLLRERGGRLVPPDPHAPAVRANPGGLAVVLGNLVANALKHNDRSPAPLVRVDVRPSQEAPGMVEVVVEDDGPGFSQESLARLEDALSGRENPRGLGRSGFGLVLVARAAERMGGRMKIGASPEGGAAVRVLLPAAP